MTTHLEHMTSSFKLKGYTFAHQITLIKVIMKKIILTGAIAVMITTLSFSQEDLWGIKVGGNLTTIKFSDGTGSITPNRAIKWHAGVYLNEMLSEKVAFQPEALISGIGYKPEDSTPVDNITLTYFAVPLMLKYYVSETFNIHAGPQLSRLLFATEFNGVSIAEGTKSFEIALGVGAELNVTEAIGLSFRYVGGANTDDTGSEFSQRSSTFQFSLLAGM